MGNVKFTYTTDAASGKINQIVVDAYVSSNILASRCSDYSAGNCYTLQDVKKKTKNSENVKLKASPFNDKNQRILCKAFNLIKTYYSVTLKRLKKN